MPRDATMFYARISDKKFKIAEAYLATIGPDDDWYKIMEAKFGAVFDEFAKFWKGSSGKETANKMSFYMPHNAHWLVQWAVVKHPELFTSPKESEGQHGQESKAGH